MRDKWLMKILLLVSILLLAFFLTVGLTADNYQYFLSRRTPKVVAMVIAGIAIAQSSLVFQTITHNRILTPSIMGFDSLYVFTQVTMIVVFGGIGSALISPFISFAVSVFIMVLFSLTLFNFYFKSDNGNILSLLLLGVVFGQLFSNIAAFMMMLMDPSQFAFAQGVMFASFNNVNRELVYLCIVPLLIVIALLYKQHRVLDVFWLDRDNAISLGVDIKRVTKQVMILITLLIALSTALVGPVLFFGLLVANLCRQLFSSYQHKILLIGSSLMAICMLLSGQWIIEKLFTFETTLSVVINFVGGLYFLSLLIRQKIQ